MRKRLRCQRCRRPSKLKRGKYCCCFIIIQLGERELGKEDTQTREKTKA